MSHLADVCLFDQKLVDSAEVHDIYDIAATLRSNTSCKCHKIA